MAVEDEENHNLINPKVQVSYISLESPAEKAGLKLGDTILELKFEDETLKTNKVQEIKDFVSQHKGEEIFLTIERENEILEFFLTPRVSFPEKEGPMGVALLRTALRHYPWYEAPIQGFSAAAGITKGIVLVFGDIIVKKIQGESLQPGLVEIRGPVGIVHMASKALEKGINEYLWLMALIAIFLTIFNILPIPALDGGKLVFLGIEKIRGKPINEKIEQKFTAVFFILLIILMLWVTIGDIGRIF